MSSSRGSRSNQHSITGYRRYVAVVLGVIIPPVRGIVVRMDWRCHLIGAMTLGGRTSGDQRTGIQYRCSS